MDEVDIVDKDYDLMIFLMGIVTLDDEENDELDEVNNLEKGY